MNIFRDKFKAPYFYGYYITDINLDDISELIILILIEEFILLNRNEVQNKDSNIKLEYDAENYPE